MSSLQIIHSHYQNSVCSTAKRVEVIRERKPFILCSQGMYEKRSGRIERVETDPVKERKMGDKGIPAQYLYATAC
jgi:hypothetical protein